MNNFREWVESLYGMNPDSKASALANLGLALFEKTVPSKLAKATGGNDAAKAAALRENYSQVATFYVAAHLRTDSPELTDEQAGLLPIAVQKGLPTEQQLRLVGCPANHCPATAHPHQELLHQI